MHMPSGIIPDWMLMLCNVIAVIFVLLAVWRMDRKVLQDLEQGMIIGVTYAFLCWLYTMSAGVTPGMTVHFLGVMLTVMMFGPWLALLLLAVVQLTLTLAFSIGALETLGFNVVMSTIVPALAAAGVHEFTYYKLPHTFPVYIIQVGIGDLICMWSVDLVLSLQLLVFTDYIPDKVFSDFSLVLFMMGGMEATISTMIACLLIFFLPQALTTFSDHEYLDGK